MKAITLWQPWATLIRAGAKTIETRSWATSHRGPLAIHAARRPVHDGYRMGDWIVLRNADDGEQYLARWPEGEPLDPHEKWFWLGYGVIVATATLLDVVPISNRWGAAHRHGRAALTRDHRIFGGEKDGLWLVSSDGGRGVVDGYAEDQLPFGDFTDGRWAWLLGDVEPLSPPVAARGRQQLWTWDAA